MATDKNDQLGDKAPDQWREFRGDESEPVGIEELKRLNLAEMPEGICVSVLDDYFPDTTVWRDNEWLICEIQEHVYTKYWEHKFSTHAFVEGMERAVRRLAREGHPLANPSRDNEDDVHLFVRWHLRLPRAMAVETVVSSIKAAFDLVWQRTDAILENSDSVLVLGKDTGPAFDRLMRIASKLQELGYHTYVIKEETDRMGESVIQKVMRYALSSKFVLIENTEASGHLYEIPHVTKDAECVTVILQEEGKGATWMFEDAYAKHTHMHKFLYREAALEQVVEMAAAWAEGFIRDFVDYQKGTLPWFDRT